MSRSGYKKRLGNYGEELAMRAYHAAGYVLLDKQFRCFLGEIDLIFRKGQTIYFVEVRTKTGQSFGTAEESVNKQKSNRIRRISEWYMVQKGLTHLQPQYDLVTIQIDKRKKRAWLKRLANAF